MKVRQLGERRLIERIRGAESAHVPGVILGIGDDAAVVCGPRRLLVTTDMLVEGVDFLKRIHPPRLLGRKALNVNLSDIAAMGGRPLHAVLGLAVPGTTDVRWVDDFLAGFRSAAREHGVALIGGDISDAGEVVISVTVTGEANRFVTRSGAKPGDAIFVSGTLGDAAMGLRLLKRGGAARSNANARPLIKAFLDTSPRLELGTILARERLASAMIDISDGLSVDLRHICEESGAGAEIELGKVPLSAGLRRFAKDPLALALNGGEDFELLFTVRPANVPRVRRLARRFDLSEIGRVKSGRRILAIDASGKKTTLVAKGYEHFRGR